MKRFLLIDGNSIGHAANNATKLTVGTTQVQAIYGFLRTMRALCAVYGPYKPIVLWDGASWRKLVYADYKLNRDQAKNVHEQRVLDQKEIFKKQSGAIEKALRLLGVTQIRALNMEADDLAGILVKRWEGDGSKVTLVSGDRDWIQLVSPDVVWFDPINDRKVTTANFEQFTGVSDARQFVELKAMMGDAGDNVPPMGGVGEKGAKEFLATYGSVANFSMMVLDKTIDVKKLPKKYRAIAEDEDKMISFSRNLSLVDLNTTARPAPVNLRVDDGTPDLSRFRTFCERLLFKSFLQDFDNWTCVFPAFQMEQAA